MGVREREGVYVRAGGGDERGRGGKGVGEGGGGEREKERERGLVCSVTNDEENGKLVSE